MKTDDRGVSPVISVILMVAIVVILAAAVSVFFLSVASDINEPAPNVADTTGEFAVAPPVERAGDNQIVRITHSGGDSVVIEEIEIIVRASGPNLNTEARLVNLPSGSSQLDNENNIKGNEKLVDASDYAEIITNNDPWTVGDTIQFRIAVGGADFRNPPKGSNPEADELEVIIVHTPSDTIISEHTFRP